MGKGAEMNCGESCMKYLLFFFNFLFFIIGAALLGIGIWLRVDAKMQSVATIAGTSDPYAAVYCIIALGAFVFIAGFLGCAGACCESKCMLGTYAGLVVLVVIIQIAAAIAAGVMQNDLKKSLQTSMDEQVKTQYGQADYKGVTEAWDFLQKDLKCCGSKAPSDWDSSAWSTTPNTVPQSCCGQDGTSTCPATDAYSQGCYDSFWSFVKKNLGIIIGVCVGVVVFEILAIVFACCVLKAI